MDPEHTPDLDWPAIVRSAGPYPRAAFEFVREGLAHTVERLLLHAHAGALSPSEIRHVTGQQLSIGLRDYAVEKYGLLAPSVLRHWNILRTEDFGRIVYALIDAGVMSKSEEDSIDDFHAVYDFEEAFAVETLAQRLARR